MTIPPTIIKLSVEGAVKRVTKQDIDSRSSCIYLTNALHSILADNIGAHTIQYDPGVNDDTAHDNQIVQIRT